MWDIPADAGLLCDRQAVSGAAIKGRRCNITLGGEMVTDYKSGFRRRS